MNRAAAPPGDPLRIAVAGASGRMGRALIDAISGHPDLVLAAALDVAGSGAIGQLADASADPGDENAVRISADPRNALAAAQILIDFTRPEGTLKHLAICRELEVKAVIGTTGFIDAQKAEIAAHARSTAIVLSPNMSIGVNVMLGLVASAARALGDGYDIEIIEAHHRHKLDAPSGTALLLGEAAAAALGRNLKDCAVYARDGRSSPDGGERGAATIGFASIRGGDIVGDHTVLFAGTGERIEITHRSSSRSTYAEGALRAARFVAGQASGLFDMNDVLGIGAA